MLYKSTRDSEHKVSAAQAIVQGLSAEGGLYVPEELPEISSDRIAMMAEFSYEQRAISVLSEFLTDFSKEQIEKCIRSAYTEEKFGSNKITELSHLYSGTYMLELWHGPTCAFKDMALQLLPHLLTESARIVDNKKEIVILVATSGDTGKAALEGFKDVDGTRVIVFYPDHGVSPMQKRQMTTQEGENVYVCAINGNFDDAQTAVKTIFTDAELAQLMSSNSMMFSSANSMNWGRLVPQIVYYISAYCDLVQNEEIENGEKINVVVPTGNFGNILAAYYAKQMGMPFDRLICASNENNVLTDFISTGVYDKNRKFKATISPSMDILISSNLERLIYALSDQDDNAVSEWYKQLAQNGKFTVSEKVKEKLTENFYGGFCTDEQTKETIRQTFDKYSYLCDTHTAVAIKVYHDYVEQTGDDKKVIIASTANPYKFTSNVLSSICDCGENDEYKQMEIMSEKTGLEIPEALAKLKNSEVRFDRVIEKESIKQEVKSQLSLD